MGFVSEACQVVLATQDQAILCERLLSEGNIVNDNS